MLKSTGGRGAVYHLPGEILPTPEDVFGQKQEKQERSSSILNPSSSILPGKPLGLAKKRDSNGCLLSDQLPKPVIDDLAITDPIFRKELERLAIEPRTKRKIEREALAQTVLVLCANHFITLSCLAELVNRKPATLRNHCLSPLIRQRRMLLAFPKTPTHEKQAYTSAP